MSYAKGLVVYLLAVLLLAGASFAETVTLDFTGTGSNSIGGEYTYPYDFTITAANGSTLQTSLLCDTYSNSITSGQSWTATVNTLPPMGSGGYFTNLTSQTGYSQAQNYQAAAVIFWEILNGKVSSAAGNLAIWTLFDGGTTNSGYVASVEQPIINNAFNAVTNNAYDANFYSQFTVYTPVGGVGGLTSGTGSGPQEFIGYTFSPVPEPATFPLLGSGLITMVGFLRGRGRLRRRSAL